MFDPENYTISSKLFVQLLGLIYFFVYSAFLFQIKGLLGEKGILPIGRYLNIAKRNLGKRAHYFLPNFFWLNSSDRALMTVIILALILSFLLMGNICAPLVLLMLYLCHLSIVSVGQDFLSFGWEMFLLEITFNAIFLSMTVIPNPFIWMSLNLLLFRFHFQGGAVKLQSRDANWRNLTGVAYHYQSQPLPNAVAWLAYKLPLSFQKFSTALMLIAEMIIPFGIFVSNAEIRLFVFICLVGLQAAIWFTGNFSYLNHLTVVLCVILLSNQYLSTIFAAIPPEPTPLWLDIPLSIVGAILFFLQIINLWNHFFVPNRIFSNLLRWIQPFHLANRYGIFAVMTTKRYEIVIEGSDDGVNWKEYCFYFKASEINRRPRRISPFQPRLDWQVWFLPFSDYESENWFKNFVYHLLLGTKEVVALLRVNPFPDNPPRYIRVGLYDYVFSDYKTLKSTGNWWTRTYVMPYSPVLFLKK